MNNAHEKHYCPVTELLVKLILSPDLCKGFLSIVACAEMLFNMMYSLSTVRIDLPVLSSVVGWHQNTGQGFWKLEGTKQALLKLLWKLFHASGDIWWLLYCSSREGPSPILYGTEALPASEYSFLMTSGKCVEKQGMHKIQNCHGQVMIVLLSKPKICFLPALRQLSNCSLLKHSTP